MLTLFEIVISLAHTTFLLQMPYFIFFTQMHDRDIKVHQNHAYIVSEATGHGMQVFDLTQLLIATTGSAFVETAHYSEVSDAHNVVINEDSGYAYIVGSNTCSGGLHMVNIADPKDTRMRRHPY